MHNVCITKYKVTYKTLLNAIDKAAHLLQHKTANVILYICCHMHTHIHTYIQIFLYSLTFGHVTDYLIPVHSKCELCYSFGYAKTIHA